MLRLSRNELRSRKRSIEPLSIIQFTTNTPFGLMPFNMLIHPTGEALRDMTATRRFAYDRSILAFSECVALFHCVA